MLLNAANLLQSTTRAKIADGFMVMPRQYQACTSVLKVKPDGIHVTNSMEGTPMVTVGTDWPKKTF